MSKTRKMFSLEKLKEIMGVMRKELTSLVGSVEPERIHAYITPSSKYSGEKMICWIEIKYETDDDDDLVNLLNDLDEFIPESVGNMTYLYEFSHGNKEFHINKPRENIVECHYISVCPSDPESLDKAQKRLDNIRKATA